MQHPPKQRKSYESNVRNLNVLSDGSLLRSCVTMNLRSQPELSIWHNALRRAEIIIYCLSPFSVQLY